VRKVILSLLGVLLFYSTIPLNVFSEDRVGLKLGIEIFTAYTKWENNYTKVEFDNLGPGLFISPKVKKQFGSLFFTADVTLSYFHFNGPDGLTITGPDIDTDSGFRSRMSRRDLLFEVGYNFFKFISLSMHLKYNFLKLDGDHKLASQKYEYIEQGFLYGPAIMVKLPIKKLIFFTDISYLTGVLNTDYNPAYYARSRKNQIYSKLFVGRLGLLIPVGKTLDLGFSYKSEYYYKSAKSPAYEFSYNPTDLWIQGFATTVIYSF
jgi:hypothetical protein